VIQILHEQNKESHEVSDIQVRQKYGLKGHTAGNNRYIVAVNKPFRNEAFLTKRATCC